MNRKVLVTWAATVCLIGGGAWWYLFSAGSVPEGQPALAGAAAFRASFTKGVEKMRIVAQLSPSRDLQAAAALQAMLLEFEAADVQVYVIWQPLAETDKWPPPTGTLAYVWDKRAKQYWDNEKALRATLGEMQAAVYSRGASYDSPAVRTDALERDLEKLKATVRNR